MIKKIKKSFWSWVARNVREAEKENPKLDAIACAMAKSIKEEISRYGDA